MTQPAAPISATSWPRVVADALEAPAGARWHRVALQVNPYGYKGRSAPSKKFPDEQSYNEAIVGACRQWNIELIAITDHWCAKTAEGLAQAAERAGIVVLPGFEAVSREGIHLLVLFERGTGYDEVDAAIGACGGLDASRYLPTQRAVDRLAPLADQRRQVDARIGALYDERRQLLAELGDHASAERRKLSQACSVANDALPKTVRVQPDFSPRALADASRAGTEQLDAFGIKGAQAANLLAAGEELFLRLEEMTVGLAAAALNVGSAATPDFRDLDDLSKGQKETALLLILLATLHGPLIVDQPEDDLDNRFIWEGVVPRVRALKGGPDAFRRRRYLYGF